MSSIQTNGPRSMWHFNGFNAFPTECFLSHNGYRVSMLNPEDEVAGTARTKVRACVRVRIYRRKEEGARTTRPLLVPIRITVTPDHPQFYHPPFRKDSNFLLPPRSFLSISLTLPSRSLPSWPSAAANVVAPSYSSSPISSPRRALFSDRPWTQSVSHRGLLGFREDEEGKETVARSTVWAPGIDSRLRKLEDCRQGRVFNSFRRQPILGGAPSGLGVPSG